MRCFSIRKRRNNLPWYKCFQFLLGASACVQQHLYQEGITWCQKGLAVSFDECRKSQYYFGDSFHLITHVKKQNVSGSHMLLTLINKRIQETGRLVMKTANNRNYLKQHWVQTFTWMIILIISALTIIHSRCQTTQNSYQTWSLKSKLCNFFHLMSYHWSQNLIACIADSVIASSIHRKCTESGAHLHVSFYIHQHNWSRSWRHGTIFV